MKKKYLAYCLALSMVLSTSAPVLASEQVDVVAESVEEPDVTVDSEIETIEPEDDVAVFENNSILTESEQESVENSAIDSFDDGSDSTDFASEEDGWIQSEEVTGLSFKYDSSNQTFYMKSSIPVALPDNTQSGWTSEWRNKYGTELNNAKTVVIEGEITQIGKFNFDNGRPGAYDNLEKVVLSPNVTKISTAAFSDIDALKSINLNNVQIIENAAFADSGVESVTFENEELKIGEYAFQNCTALTTVTAKKIQDLGSNAFNGCTSLKTFNCESNIDKIPKECFKGTALTAFDFKNVTSVGRNAFNKSSLKSACYAGTKEQWDSMIPAASWSGSTIPAGTIVHCKADAIESKDATCTENGWKEVGVCEVCGEHYSYPTEENAIPATGHTWSEDYVVKQQPAQKLVKRANTVQPVMPKKMYRRFRHLDMILFPK